MYNQIIGALKIYCDQEWYKDFDRSFSNYISSWGFINDTNVFSSRFGYCHYSLGSSFDGMEPPVTEEFDSFFTGSMYSTNKPDEVKPEVCIEEVVEFLCSDKNPWKALGKIERIKNEKGATLFFHVKDFNTDVYKTGRVNTLLMSFCIGSRFWRDKGFLKNNYINLRKHGFSVEDSFFLQGILYASSDGMTTISDWDGAHVPFSYNSDWKKIRTGDFNKGVAAGRNSSLWNGGNSTAQEIMNRCEKLPVQATKSKFSKIALYKLEDVSKIVNEYKKEKGIE